MHELVTERALDLLLLAREILDGHPDHPIDDAARPVAEPGHGTELRAREQHDAEPRTSCLDGEVAEELADLVVGGFELALERTGAGQELGAITVERELEMDRLFAPEALLGRLAAFPALEQGWQLRAGRSELDRSPQVCEG